VIGVHVSRASREVMDSAPFMQSLPNHHWKALMKLMHRAEVSFEQILDHQVVSHIRLAKSLVPYKSMISPSTKSPLKYFGDPYQWSMGYMHLLCGRRGGMVQANVGH
jgi:hypothetical protein